MSIKGVTVTFAHDLDDEAAERVIDAIRMVRGVASVEPSEATGADHVNREQIRYEYADRAVRAVRDVFFPPK
jgi:hypothetical protein